jgi:hypothetical protein
MPVYDCVCMYVCVCGVAQVIAVFVMQLVADGVMYSCTIQTTYLNVTFCGSVSESQRDGGFVSHSTIKTDLGLPTKASVLLHAPFSPAMYVCMCIHIYRHTYVHTHTHTHTYTQTHTHTLTHCFTHSHRHAH